MRVKNINIRDIMNEALVSGGIIVDVRSREAFSKKHIPMAVNVPYEDIIRGKFTLPKYKEIILYCETGGDSILASKYLIDHGYKAVNTVGGIKNYKGSLTNK